MAQASQFVASGLWESMEFDLSTDCDGEPGESTTTDSSTLGSPIMSYVIFGRKVANEYLAIGTFALTGAIATLATSGGDKKAKDPKQEVPITASSGDEESFIRDFVAKMEREEAGQKH